MARVDGVPILAGELRAQMAGGQGRREALRALISEQLLANESIRRGLAREPRVQDTLRRVLASAFTARFRRDYTERSIPPDLVRRAYALNRSVYVHPEMAKVLHILAFATPKDDDAHHAAALRLARKVRAIATAGRLSPEEFRQVVDLVKADAGDIELQADEISTPRRGMTEQSFADAAFALKEPGDISPVVRTRYGYHVLYLVERLAPRNDPLSRVEPEIRRRILADARRIGFKALVKKLEQEAGVVMHLDAVPPPRGGARRRAGR